MTVPIETPPEFPVPVPSPVSLPSPVPVPSPVFNRDAPLHLANFHFEILTGCQFDEQIDARIPAVPSTATPVITGFVEDHPIVWHSCEEFICDLCNLTFPDKMEQKDHNKTDRHRDELFRQLKWRHTCGLCDVTVTSLRDFRIHALSKKHGRNIKKHYLEISKRRDQ